NLNGGLMIVGREQHQVFLRDSEFALAALAQNGSRDIEAIERIIDDGYSPPAVEQRHGARNQWRVGARGIGLVATRAVAWTVRGHVHASGASVHSSERVVLRRRRLP